MKVLAVEKVQGDVFALSAGTREARTTGRNVLNGIQSVVSAAGGVGGVLARGYRVIELAVLGVVSSIPGGLEAVSTTSSRTGGGTNG